MRAQTRRVFGAVFGSRLSERHRISPRRHDRALPARRLSQLCTRGDGSLRTGGRQPQPAAWRAYVQVKLTHTGSCARAHGARAPRATLSTAASAPCPLLLARPHARAALRPTATRVGPARCAAVRAPPSESRATSRVLRALCRLRPRRGPRWMAPGAART
jgi:hypothetical protein